MELETGPRISSTFAVIAFNKKPKLQNAAIISQSATLHEQKRFIAKVEKKIEDILGEDQFEFRKGKGKRDAIGIMRIISERSSDVDEEL